jgi:hypothetical protein
MDNPTHGTATTRTLEASLLLVKGLHGEEEDEGHVDDDEEEEDEDGMIVAKTERASRAARSPPPSNKVQAAAWKVAAALADALENRGLTRASRQPIVQFASKLSRTSARGDFVGSVARPAQTLSHVFSLQRPIDANARESSYLTYQSVLPLESFQLAAAGMRSNSVRASVVHKQKKTQGGGQQTTRNNLQELAASFASQSTAVAIALGVARRSFGKASDPGATFSTNLAQFVDGTKKRVEGPFVTTSSTRLLPHALPIRVSQHNLLTTMQGFANAELEMGAIRSLVPQQVASLRSICVKICDKTDGVSVWAAWVLLIHMLSDPRLRKLVRASPITDHEVAVAHLFTNYARAEVTRRARMEQAAAQKAAQKAAKEAAKEKKQGGQSAVQKTIAKLDQPPPAKAEAEAERPLTEAMVALQAQIEAQKRSDKQTLSLKRKRPPCSGVVQVSGGVLDYWAAALSSEYASILKLMITQSKAIANEASVQTLTGQAPPGFSSERNALLVDISTRNAVRSAEALSGLVITSEQRVPKVVSWRCRTAEGKLRVHTGLVRSSTDASNTTIHAAQLAPEHVQESTGHTAIVWSLAVRNATPFDASTSLVPGVVEGLVHHRAVELGKVPLRNKHYTTRVLDAVKQRTQRAACDGSLDVALTGVPRSFLVLRALLVVSDSQYKAGLEIGSRMGEAHAAAREGVVHAPGVSDIETIEILSSESLGGVAEPFATPSNNLALALEANEQIRVLFKDKSHRNDPCRVLCGVAMPAEMTSSTCEEHDRPQSLLPIVDCSVEMLEDDAVALAADSPPLPNRRDARLRSVAIKLAVCGDTPVRLPELLDLYARDESREDHVKQTFEQLALLLGGAARASEVNDVAASVTAGHVNSSIACAKRILVGDLNMRLLCTLYQVFRVGTSNVPRSFETTPWSGTYGAGFDIGTSGGIGVRASSLTADNRNHGKILMAQAQVDEWCAEAAKTHYVPVDDQFYSAVPREARGVPHATIPGLHAYLDQYVDGLEHARTLIGVQDRRTVDSLQCLPLSPFAERQAPHVSEGSDPTVPKRFRNPDDAVDAEGRAFQVDATCADVAILREPLVPCVAITSPQDCIFGQAQPFLTSVIGAAAALARLARSASLFESPGADAERTPESEVFHLYSMLKNYYDCEYRFGNHYKTGFYWASVAAVLLNSIFTSAHQMAEQVIVDGNAKGPAACAARMRGQEANGEPAVGAPLKDLVSAEEFARAKAWWKPFTRHSEHLNPWVHVSPLLVLLSKINGSLDLPVSTYDEVARAVHNLVCSGAWLHASPDGKQPPREPSPLAGLRAPSHVRSEHVTPVFVGKTGSLHDSKPATACVVGVLPMGFQQILALLQGASHDPTVVANYAHNFSFLIYRPSAAPDIVTNCKKQRSSKAISCVNVEGDEAAFGTRADKLAVCKLHRVAWRINLDLVRPLCLRVAKPRPERQLARGDRARVDYAKQRKRELDAEGLLTKQQVVADAAMHAAAFKD